MATNKELTIQVINLQRKIDELVFKLTMVKGKMLTLYSLKENLLKDIQQGLPAEKILCKIADELGKATDSQKYGELVKIRLQNQKDDLPKE